MIVLSAAALLLATFVFPSSADVSDTTAPTIDSLAVSSSPSTGDVYGSGEAIEVTVTFDENVAVTGTPQLTLTVGAEDRVAECVAHSSIATKLVCSYTVAAGDADTDGISIGANQLALNGGTVKDRAVTPNDAVLTHDAVSAQASHKVISAPAAVLPVPHQRQIDWQEQEFTAFVHFGINTFNDVEWGDGTASPSSFNPTELDTDQWVQAYKAAGMNMVILTAKHHDGFTLWPSSTAPNYSVAATPWKSGKGDVVKDLETSVRKYGLDFGIYISSWDRYQEDVLQKTSDEYNDIFNAQLTEVLSNYGEIKEVWFDGASQSQYTINWDRHYTTVRTLQPDAVIAIQGPDVDWIGNENGDGKDPLWSPQEKTPNGSKAAQEAIYRKFNTGGALVDSAFLGGSNTGPKNIFWKPQEVDVSIRPGWFWHADENNRLKSLKRMQQMYYGSVGGNSLFLLNVPPDTRGLLHENDVARLKEFGDLIERTFATDFTDGATATASNVRGAGVVSTYAASNLIDDDDDTYWTTDDSITSPSFTVTFDAVKSVGLVQLQEYIQLGQRVQTFKVEAMVSGSWTQVATGNTIGYKRILELSEPVTTDKIRVTFTSSRDIPVIHSFGAYARPVVPTPNHTRANNVAYQSHATQSSQNGSAAAERAVDGNTNGQFSEGSVTHTADNESNPWWQTDLGASFNISEIKLWNRTDCCGSRLSNFHVFVSDSPFTSNDAEVIRTTAGVWHHRHTGTVGTTGVISVPNVSGRYVRIQLTASLPLHLAEVEVIGSAKNLVGSGTGSASGSVVGHGPVKAFDGSYTTSWRVESGTAWISYSFGSTGRPNVTGYTVTAATTGLNPPTGWTFEGSNDGGTTWTSLDTQTDQTFIRGQRRTYSIESDQTFNIYRFSMTNSASGTIDVAEIELYAGPIGPSLVTNVATGGTATQSSAQEMHTASASASKAIDGDTDGRYPDVSHTSDSSVANEWWQVDLGSSHLLDRIVVWNRTDCCGNRLNPYYVLVSETPFGSSTLTELLADNSVTHFEFTSAPNPNQTVTPTATLTGRYVRVQLGGSTVRPLALAEVQVYGLPLPDTTAPTIDSLAVTSTPAAGGTYKSGEKIEFAVTFTEPVTVTGKPKLAITLGSNAMGTKTRQAAYESGSSSKTLIFSYTSYDREEDLDGVSITGGTVLSLPIGSTIKDAANNSAVLTHTAGLAAQSGHLVDTIRPAKLTGFSTSHSASQVGQVTVLWTVPCDYSITGYQYRTKVGTAAYGSWTDIPGSSLNRDTDANKLYFVVTGLENVDIPGIAWAPVFNRIQVRARDTVNFGKPVVAAVGFNTFSVGR